MTNLQRYRKNTIRKAVIIPLIITIIASVTFVLSLPTIQNALPNGMSSSQEVVCEEQ